MKQYLDLLDRILVHGAVRSDRTGTGTLSVFGHQMRFDLKDGFPLLTTKKVHMKSVVHELLWFIRGETNIRPLVENNVRIWNEWPFETYRRSAEYAGETLDAFIERIKNDEAFAMEWGDLGPVYGKQWRRFSGRSEDVDQLKHVLEMIKTNPSSRRLIVNSWHAAEIDDMALPPCHVMLQFHVQDDTLSCQLYQRSADVFLGVPFNIASYSLLTLMVAHVCGLEAGEFIHTSGDAHLYKNHLEQARLQMTRTPRPLPRVELNPLVKDLFDFRYEDIRLEGYRPHPAIKAEVSV